jgi:hypothetical protein
MENSCEYGNEPSDFIKYSRVTGDFSRRAQLHRVILGSKCCDLMSSTGCEPPCLVTLH